MEILGPYADDLETANVSENIEERHGWECSAVPRWFQMAVSAGVECEVDALLADVEDLHCVVADFLEWAHFVIGFADMGTDEDKAIR